VNDIDVSLAVGYQYDQGQRSGFEPGWQLWYDGTQPVKAWLAERRPSHLVIVYNDHMNYFDLKASRPAHGHSDGADHEIAGTEAAELSMWYAMRASLSDDARTHYSFYTLPAVAGCGVIALTEP
jgi:hypothetical protein